MRSALVLGAYWGGVILAAAGLLGKFQSKPVGGVTAFQQAFRACPQCADITAHLIHSPTCRRCLTCGTLTNPGDPQ